MVENIGRKLTLIAVLLTTALTLVLLPDKPLRMGLDLQGGTRLVYSLDFSAAIAEGRISPDENEQELMQQTMRIIRNRIDPNGVLEPIIRQEGDNIVIELPGAPEFADELILSALAKSMEAGDTLLTLEASSAKDFPTGEGIVRVGTERMSFERREGDVLLNLGRTGTPTAHPVGERVELLSTDKIQSLIANLGELRFLILAESSDLAAFGTDETTEHQRFEAWREKNPDRRVSDFNEVAYGDGGPNRAIWWFARMVPTDDGKVEGAPAMVLRPKGPDDTFVGDDLDSVSQSRDGLGYPAVAFEFKAARKGDFTRFTGPASKGGNQGRQMAIVLNRRIEVAPVIKSPLPGGGIIEGRYTTDEVKAMITVLRSGSLPIALKLENDERVGPTLGADYVRRGQWGGGLALLSVVVFMVLYYRRLGIYSAISLGATLLMLMGGMVFTQQTLTLPGIAGIILTVGMAVDANILIFDRIREEMDKGRNVMQAAKNGFDQAMSAIVDANVTTLITAIALYKFGTGPVRGFAVTLSMGVLTSMFSALVITRVLVALQLEKGQRKFHMGTWLVTANYRFLAKAKLAMTGSGIVIVAGLALFFNIDANDKLGLDFLGGTSARVRLESPEPSNVVRDLLTSGGLAGAQVKPIESSAVGDGAYGTYEITIKGRDRGSQGDLASFEKDLAIALGDVMQRGPVTLDPSGTFELYFETVHPLADVLAGLDGEGLADVQVTARADHPTRFDGSATFPGAKPEITLLLDAFEDAEDQNGHAFVWSKPVPELTGVSAQVVGELRDKAILAMLVSLFAIVMYIRVRFYEYSYGFAAVAALVHDVLITLGVIAVGIKTGLVAIEINLPLIAAFLTIIGYSLNDTIVLFDRVRENLPRMGKATLAEILDRSINQTLSRTILTSLTTLMAVTILLAFNYGTGNVLEGFGFAMMIGVIVGTYSSVYIAAPVLVYFENRRMKKGGQELSNAASTSTSKAKSAKPAAATS